LGLYGVIAFGGQQQGMYPLAHFCCGFARKGNRDDLFRSLNGCQQA